MIVFNDIYGNRVELSHPVERIIVNYESIAEMLIAIGAADHIVGVDRYTYEGRKDLMGKMQPGVINIGDYQNFYVETISQMHPEDLVIIVGTSQLIQNVKNVQALNPEAIVSFNCDSPEQLYDEAYALGEMTGHREGALRYIEFNKKYQELIKSRLANITDEEMPTIYRTYGSSTIDYVTGGIPQFNFITDTLHVHNANRELNITNPIVNREWIFQKDPDIIFKVEFWRPYYGDNTTGKSIISERKDFINRPGYEKLRAVQSGRVYFINRFINLNPRAIIGLLYQAKAIYPDRFADINPDAVRREYAAEFGIGDEPGVEWFYPPFESVNATQLGIAGTNA